MSFIVAGIGAAVGVGKFFSARKDKKKAQREQAKAKAAMEKQKAAFAAIDTSNPFAGLQNQFAGLENTMEDLTVNQQQAQFEAQQGQQQRANIMDQMKGAAGGSGIAALAQQMAQSGQLASQQASASIGSQEAANQKAAATQAGQLQQMEAQGATNIASQKAQGEQWSTQMETDKVSTLLGMEQGAMAGAQERADAAKAGQWDAVGDIAGSVTGALSDRRLKKNIKRIGTSSSGIGVYTFEYIDKEIGEGIFQGTMSDEVPESVVLKHSSGYDMIDYSKIDVEFKSIK